MWNPKKVDCGFVDRRVLTEEWHDTLLYTSIWVWSKLCRLLLTVS